jgi:predicted RND superfamily exporter protein
MGVPFSNLSQMVPFIILGVGLDVSFFFDRAMKIQSNAQLTFISILQTTKKDTFIITGVYFRKLAEEHKEESRDENELITQRILDTMEEVGLSISMTTITTALAFMLGCLSTIPGIRWVCLCKFLESEISMIDSLIHTQLI